MKNKETYDSTYANMIIEKYEKAIWKKIYEKMPACKEIKQEDREDAFQKVVCTFLEVAQRGKLNGRCGEASALSYLYTLVENEGISFHRKRKIDKKYVNHEPEHNNEDDERDPWIETFSYNEPKLEFMPAERYEAQEQEELITKESEQPDILEFSKEGCEIKQVASALKIPYETAKKRIQREGKRMTKKAEPIGLQREKKKL